MMKFKKSIFYMSTALLLLATLFLFSCNNSSGKEGAVAQKDTAQVIEKKSFFPVTSYIKGQIYSIAQRGINPLKYTTVNDKTDSVWVKVEEMNQVFAEFLSPEIDS